MNPTSGIPRTLAAPGRALLLCGLYLYAQYAQAAEDPNRFKDVKIVPEQVTAGLYMLTGAGGNIAASIGADGTLIVDDQFAPLAERILVALNELDGGEPKLIVNTHFHGDHTGGNGRFGQSGTIIAHDNVRARLLGDAELSRAALPVVVFQDQLRVHFNDDAIDLIHMPAGHTDGDAVVWFRQAGVIHLGDHFFNGRFPFIDLEAGGSVEGVISNLQKIIRMVPDDIRIIPGHGAQARIADLQATLSMLRKTRSQVREALDNGQSVDAIVKAGIDPEYRQWGSGFINEERWIRTLAAGG